MGRAMANTAPGQNGAALSLDQSSQWHTLVQARRVLKRLLHFACASAHVNRIRVNPGPILARKLQPAFDAIDAWSFDRLLKPFTLLLHDHLATSQQPHMTGHRETGQQLLSLGEFYLVAHEGLGGLQPGRPLALSLRERVRVRGKGALDAVRVADSPRAAD